jgi:glycosyltransferase involved in cell wall biosynthesis
VGLQFGFAIALVKTDLRVLICNERFLPRFGVDRILLLLAKYLTACGMDVSLACLRCERAILGNLADRVKQIQLPRGGGIAEIDSVVAETVLKSWDLDRPHVLVSGGWPFFELAARSPSYGVPSLFIDAGSVPHDGFTGPALLSQQEVRFLRESYLPFVSRIVSISKFIRTSQSEPDRGSDLGITTVLLGADHLQTAFFDTGVAASIAEDEEIFLHEMDRASKEGKIHVLALGRFEQVGYKNSPSVFDIFIKLSEDFPDARLIILAGGEQLVIPTPIRTRTICLKTLSDAALVEVMKRCALGISVSLWEGFNLPLAEMQWLGIPALAFAIGAHPEVIVDPYLLCGASEEMARKAVQILKVGLPPSIHRLGRYEAFREHFQWANSLQEWSVAVEELGISAPSQCANGNRLLLIDVTNSAIDPGNSGVIRVTRRLCSHLADRSDIDLAFVVWNRDLSRYTFLPASQQQFLSSNAGPYDWVGRAAAFFESTASPEDLVRRQDPRCVRRPILFFPEIVLDLTCAARMDWARTLGVSTACLFYDMLPMYASAYVSDSIKTSFSSYLDFVLQMDALWAISEYSLSELKRYCCGTLAQNLPESGTIWLPGQFSDYPRATVGSVPTRKVNILCVSTFESRKNHLALIQAFHSLRVRRRDLLITLKLVGNRHAEENQLFEQIQKAADADDQIELVGNVSDSILAAEYEHATFTVYPSLIEGFGLPILESLWMGRPCICNATGVMAELAVGGGCLTVDMKSPIELETAIERLATDTALLGQLSEQALSRCILTWRTYSDAIANEVLRL